MNQAGEVMQAKGTMWVGQAMWAGEAATRAPVLLRVRALEHWQQQSMHQALHICQIVLWPHMGHYQQHAYN